MLIQYSAMVVIEVALRHCLHNLNFIVIVRVHDAAAFDLFGCSFLCSYIVISSNSDLCRAPTQSLLSEPSNRTEGVIHSHLSVSGNIV